ncbi:hypothetical protein L226DRAFT_237095 [Lentinus tigrinus ALCF2SS1-7]|uniref:uncharacterized protein n=1 Tax=Lentinus tigrinus ALCF2SS1-7 TaxID=1328758 RepID=UPI00116607F6|nr:hypothetical protein L226DRAFT_237095 [Lentinus tigrinus ALCF2SS1-7]
MITFLDGSPLVAIIAAQCCLHYLQGFPVAPRCSRAFNTLKHYPTISLSLIPRVAPTVNRRNAFFYVLHTLLTVLIMHRPRPTVGSRASGSEGTSSLSLCVLQQTMNPPSHIHSMQCAVSARSVLQWYLS